MRKGDIVKFKHFNIDIYTVLKVRGNKITIQSNNGMAFAVEKFKLKPVKETHIREYLNFYLWQSLKNDIWNEYHKQVSKL